MKRVIAHLVGDAPIRCLDTETFEDPVISISGGVLVKSFTQFPHGLVDERDLHWKSNCWCRSLLGGKCPND